MRLIANVFMITVVLFAACSKSGGKKHEKPHKNAADAAGEEDDDKSFADRMKDLEPWLKRLDQCHKQFTKVEIHSDSTFSFDHHPDHIVEAYLNGENEDDIATMAGLLIYGGNSGDKFDMTHLGRAEVGVEYQLSTEFPNISAERGQSWMSMKAHPEEKGGFASGSWVFTKIPTKKWDEFVLEIDVETLVGRLRGKFTGCWVGQVHDRSL